MNTFSRKLCLFLVFGFFSYNLLAQGGFDLQNTKVDDLSDAQIEQGLKRAQSLGYSESDIYVYAQSQGVSATELQKLRDRIQAIKVKSDQNAREEEKDPTKENKTQRPSPAKEKGPQPYFGYDLFGSNTRDLSFETNLLIPVPEDYVLGPVDELAISIYGTSERYQQIQIAKSGNLVLPNVGPIFLSGLTLQQATLKIRGRLATIYTDLDSENPTTFLDVSLSKVRPIKVNLVGELTLPGSYTVNGLSSVFNAVYVAGGPTLSGTMRNIKVFRGDKQIATVDYYDFLARGVTKDNIRLRNDDIIMVGPRLSRIEVAGAVRRPGIYETKPGETLADLLLFTGGFSDDAYKNRIKVIRNNSKEKIVADVYEEQYEIFEIKPGDVYNVGQVLNRFANRVIIRGAVFRPGPYALQNDMTLQDLIEKADGLRGDAFLNRAVITRTKPDFSTSIVNVDLRDVVRREQVSLKPEDVVEVLSSQDIEAQPYIKVSGEVNRGGVFPYSVDMTVEDVIFLAEGFTQAADITNVEISRRSEQQTPNNLAKIIKVQVDNQLANGGEKITIMPYDHVFVRRNPNYFEQKTVEVIGEVEYPGKYTLTSENERISDLLKRSGGLKNNAFVSGATLVRNTEFFRSENELESRKEDLQNILNTLDTAFLSEADEKLIDEIYEEINNQYLFPNEQEVNLASKAKRDRLKELAAANPFLPGLEIKRTESIAIDVRKILANPGGREDLILEDLDIISVPKKLTTIRLRGKVLYPNTVRFEDGLGLKQYINKAGGFDNRAKKNKTYVVYANGEVSRTKRFLFFRNFPSPEPGCEVIVPVKPLKIPLKPGELVGLTSGLATLAVLVTQLIQLNQN